jgi:glycosyltransferase involved in cell wall biosynthesis
MDFDFSVIIPAYNASDSLRWCLQGVIEQDYGGSFEVVVVESGDSSNLAELSADFPQVRFVVAPCRLYSGQARNVAAAHARGAVLAFLDADCKPVRGWLSALNRAHQGGHLVVSGALDNANPESATGTAEYLVSHSAYSPVVPAHELAGTTAASGNMSVSREVFDKAGGFAGTMRANDFLFSRKLHEAGIAILFCPEAAALHLNPEDTKDYMHGQVERGYWNAAARMHVVAPGSAARRFPPLALMLFFLRLYRMIDRCVRYGVVPLTTLVRVLPLCVGGLAAWTLGYVKASIERGTRLPEREALPRKWKSFDIIYGRALGDEGRDLR